MRVLLHQCGPSSVLNRPARFRQIHSGRNLPTSLTAPNTMVIRHLPCHPQHINWTRRPRKPCGCVSAEDRRSVSGRLTSTNDVQVSSIPGVPYPVYIAGSRITRMYPFGPLPGCAAMITLLSHDGTCCIGMNTDTLAITDPGGLADDPAGRAGRGGGTQGLTTVQRELWVSSRTRWVSGRSSGGRRSCSAGRTRTVRRASAPRS